MTDLEMTLLCAQAMGIDHFHGTEVVSIRYPRGDSDIYDPLHDGSQALEIVRRFGLNLCQSEGFLRHPERQGSARWYVSGVTRSSNNADLNRAIVECVAKMQASQSTR